MPPPALLDLATLDCSKVVVDQEGIRRVNPQRFQMEQLNGIIHIDTDQQIIVGFKDVGLDEFWVAGHMPDYPLLPGVLMCEAAAQLCSFYVMRSGLIPGSFLGFGGMENIRFRSPVRPGERLIMIAKLLKLRRSRTIFTVQAFVEARLVFQGDIFGVAMSRYGDQGDEES